jgi:hypothetical protein
MRHAFLLALLALLSLAAAVPTTAQGILVPIRCTAGCAEDARLPAALVSDSVLVSIGLEHEDPQTYASFTFRHGGPGTVDAGFFFPLPRGATVSRLSVSVNGKLTQYNEWSRPDESRWIFAGASRAHPVLRAYAADGVLHAPVRDIPPGGVVHLQVGYSEPRSTEGETLTYRYPLSGAARAAPIGALRLVATLRHEAGFRDVASPTHPVTVRLGTESAPCPPQHRCGTRGVPSQRTRVVVLEGGREAQARDFVLHWTPGVEPLPPPGDRGIDASWIREPPAGATPPADPRPSVEPRSGSPDPDPAAPTPAPGRSGRP